MTQDELCKYGQDPKSCTSNPMDCQCAIDAALAQTQEPVAHWSDCAVHSEPAYPKGECDCGGFAIPPQRTWVDLTDEEIQAVAKRARSKDHAVTLTNKLLREKNA